MRAILFLTGLAIGASLGWAVFLILANYGVDYSIPLLPT